MSFARFSLVQVAGVFIASNNCCCSAVSVLLSLIFIFLMILLITNCSPCGVQSSTSLTAIACSIVNITCCPKTVPTSPWFFCSLLFFFLYSAEINQSPLKSHKKFKTLLELIAVEFVASCALFHSLAAIATSLFDWRSDAKVSRSFRCALLRICATFFSSLSSPHARL